MRCFVTLLAITVATQSFGAGNRLMGKWKSDEEKTIRLIDTSCELNSETKRMLLRKVEFGEMILEIDHKRMTAYYKGEKSVSHYSVIETNRDAVKIEMYDDYLRRKATKVIRVTNGTMFFPSSISNSIVEVFSRVE